MCAPKLWNSLPLDLRKSPSLTGFKKELKPYLFKVYMTRNFFLAFLVLQYVQNMFTKLKFDKNLAKTVFFGLQNTRICLKKCPPFRAAKLTRDVCL